MSRNESDSDHSEQAAPAPVGRSPNLISSPKKQTEGKLERYDDGDNEERTPMTEEEEEIAVSARVLNKTYFLFYLRCCLAADIL
jgi:hypothetical protein